MDNQSISIAVAGSGGAGAMTTGNTLFDAAAKVGWYGILSRTVGPQIRGGEAAAMLRLSARDTGSLFSVGTGGSCSIVA